MNIEGLRYAVAVRETKSFSAAARAHGVTQPALSSGIARLEDELGGRLFDRSTRGVAPTEFGLRILPLIDRAVADLDTVIAEARRATSWQARAIRVGVSPLIDTGLISAAFGVVCELPDRCDLVLHEANMDELRAGLTAGTFDVIMVPAVAPMPRFKRADIAREPVVLVNAEAGTKPIGVDGIGATPLIMMPNTCGLTRFTEDLLQAHSLPVPKYAGEAVTYRVLEDWARLGLGAAVLPLSKISKTARGYRPLVDDGRHVQITYEAIWNGAGEYSSEVEAFVIRLIQSSINVGYLPISEEPLPGPDIAS